jgi:hypothetical protein
MVLGGVAAYGLGLSALYATTGRGLSCPFRMLTGWQCPLCGATRLGSALLDGDAGAAFADNPVVLIGLILATLLGVLWMVEVLGGPAVRPPARIAGAVRAVRPNAWLAVGLLLGSVYVVLRNLS